ncbi:MAG: hypothetical protein ABEI52_04890 [Halobacteriaceae archaeon]
MIMTVLIQKARDNKSHNWEVRIGAGQGGKILSRHYKKRQALKKGRRVAKKRGDVLKEQLQWGGWRTRQDYS